MAIISPEEKTVFDGTNNHRLRIIDLMTQGGRYPINDPETMNLLLKTLNDADKNSLNQAKLRLQDKKEDDGKQNVALMTEILKNIRYDKDLKVIDDVPREIPTLPDAPDVVEGISPEELELPKAMGEAEASYDQSTEGEEAEGE